MDERKYGILISVVAVVTAAAVFFFLGLGAAPLLLPSYDTSETYELVVRQEETFSEEEMPALIEKIPLNSASEEDLMKIPGIGATFAKRIVEYRELIGSFTSLDQLMDVRGIGEGRLAQWSAYLTLN